MHPCLDPAHPHVRTCLLLQLAGYRFHFTLPPPHPRHGSLTRDPASQWTSHGDDIMHDPSEQGMLGALCQGLLSLPFTICFHSITKVNFNIKYTSLSRPELGGKAEPMKPVSPVDRGPAIPSCPVARQNCHFEEAAAPMTPRQGFV